MTDGLAGSIMGLRLAGNPFFILQFEGKWGGGGSGGAGKEGIGGVIRAQRGEEAHRRQSTNRIPQPTVLLSDDVKERQVLVAVVVVVSLMSCLKSAVKSVHESSRLVGTYLRSR